MLNTRTADPLDYFDGDSAQPANWCVGTAPASFHDQEMYDGI